MPVTFRMILSPNAFIEFSSSSTLTHTHTHINTHIRIHAHWWIRRDVEGASDRGDAAVETLPWRVSLWLCHVFELDPGKLITLVHKQHLFTNMSQ